MLALPAPAPAQSAEPAALLRQRLETLQGDPAATLRGTSVSAVPFLLELYARRDFTPAWTNAQRIDEFIAILEGTDAEGLDPDDYHAALLRDMQKTAASGGQAQATADFDVLLTDALVRLGTHLRFGKVDPVQLDSNWNIARELSIDDPVAIFQAAIDADSLRAFIDERIPRQPFYQRFKQALVRYRAIRDAGGWPALGDGPALKPGMTDPRLPALRARLAAEADLGPDPESASELYDEAVEQAVMRFQQRHGLGADGVAGRETFAAMNVTAHARIDQIKANLERSRWVFTDLTGDFIVVNIAGYRAYLVRNTEIVWETNVMVGKTYRKTPVFKASMKYLVLNPTWTVPPGILRKDILPKLKKDPGYLDQKGYLLLDRDGNPVNQDAIDWSSISHRNFPYIVRQPAGPDNALGQVKFIFPNGHFVFLHDTNHRDLFVHRERAFSSGCIRVENPLKLAELVLNDARRWHPAAIQAALDLKKTQTVHLPEPLPVLLLYWTTTVAADGTVGFLKDVYGRDQRIIARLAAPFRPAARNFTE